MTEISKYNMICILTLFFYMLIFFKTLAGSSNNFSLLSISTPAKVCGLRAFFGDLGMKLTEIELGRFWAKVDKTDGCWIWIGAKNATGYGLIRFKRKSYRAHRVSYEFANGEIPDGLYICHKCDNPSCVNPEHLFTGTATDNAIDMTNKGRSSAILTPNQVMEIFDQRGNGITHQDIANKYGIARSTVSNLMRGLNWASITGILHNEP